MTDRPVEVTADDLEAFVTIDEVAALTGYQKSTIRKLCQQSKIPHYQARPGAALLFLVSEIRQWLKGSAA